MILAIDIGNTHTVIGIFKSGKLINEWRMTSSPTRTEHAIWLHIKLFCEETNISPKAIRGISIASAVPKLTNIFSKMSEKYLSRKALVVSYRKNLGIRFKYDAPSTVGADRLCNAVAAYKKFGGPAIVIDLGTAITYDVISKKGEYLGGAIAPGVETSALELYRRTAKLPLIELQYPENIVGKNTIVSMQSGVMYGALDSMEGMVHRIKRAIGKKAVVIATGGFAQLIAEKSTVIDHIEPSLVLEGAYLIFKRNRGKQK